MAYATPTSNGLSHLESKPAALRTNSALAYEPRVLHEENEAEPELAMAGYAEEFAPEVAREEPIEPRLEPRLAPLAALQPKSLFEIDPEVEAVEMAEEAVTTAIAPQPEPRIPEAAPEPVAIVEPVTAPQPLTGKRIIVTRARHQADTLAQMLQQFGAEVILCPTIEIRPPDSWRALDEAISKLRYYQWLVFTSSNGVSHFLRRFDETGHGRAELAALKICAVGKKTAEKLQEERLVVDLMPQKFTAENLVSAFIRKFGVGQRIRGTRMLLPAAKTTRDVIRPSLEKLDISVDVVEAYQNVLPQVSSEEIVSLINQQPADYVIFTSPSTVNNLAVLLDSDQLSTHLPNTRVACIGPVTAKAAEQCGLTVHILPTEHTAPAIVELLVKDSQRLT
ncbi:MAG TPA: uroporphyrinogen-III synthase [Blastocatellia bacterium]|nr:uroporphyrinogen-III synthase [Blastocatellia bacterium]